MILAAHQPQFIPWLGYFDKIDRADVFVLLDTVQFKKNEWQNRNRIKAASGTQWLTVPVSFRFGDAVREVRIDERQNWRRKHLATLRTCYARTIHFEPVHRAYRSVIEASSSNLADLNTAMLKSMMGALDIATPMLSASELEGLPKDRDERLIALCRRLGARTYLAGSGSRAYLNVDRFVRAGIDVVFQSYRHPTYSQLFGNFTPQLSALDLLFNCGPGSASILRAGRNATKGDAWASTGACETPSSRVDEGGGG